MQSHLIAKRLAVVCASLVVAVPAACTTERPTDIASITIAGDACASCSASVSIDRDGHVREATAPSDASPDGLLDRNAGDVVARFPYDQFLKARYHADLDGPAKLVILYVRFRDGSVLSAPVALGQTRSVRTGELAAWTVRAAFDVDFVLLGPRRRAIDRAIARHAWRAVTLEELGCYGSCARYAVTFAATGDATLEDRCSRIVRRARIRVAFERVLAAVQDPRWLRPVYPLAAVDSQAARITIATVAQTFASYGPDRTTWDMPFTVAESRLDQLVHDLPWRPNVLHACA